MRRREFLQSGLKGALAFSLAGLVGMPKEAGATGSVVFELSAQGAFSTMIDGSTLFRWSLDAPSSPGPGALGSGMVVREGDIVEVVLTNRLDRTIDFTIIDVLANTPTIAPGETRTYTFTAPAAGTYMYTDGVNGFISKAMGLAGPLVVMPADGSNTLLAGGAVFDRQYTMFMSDMDSRLNQAIHDGGIYDIADYEPNYYFANGLIYPNTKKHEDTLITMSAGEDVAIRFVNGGVIEYPMHFHGYHVDVIRNARQSVTDFISRDTVLVRPNTTAEVILPVRQTGVFPLHTHYVPGVTLNGVYTNPYGGALIIMVAS